MTVSPVRHGEKTHPLLQDSLREEKRIGDDELSDQSQIVVMPDFEMFPINQYSHKKRQRHEGGWVFCRDAPVGVVS